MAQLRPSSGADSPFDTGDIASQDSRGRSDALSVHGQRLFDGKRPCPRRRLLAKELLRRCDHRHGLRGAFEIFAVAAYVNIVKRMI